MMHAAGTSSLCPQQRESVIVGVYFSQMSVTYFCRGFSCSPYYRGVRYSGVSPRRELTVNDFTVQAAHSHPNTHGDTSAPP